MCQNTKHLKECTTQAMMAATKVCILDQIEIFEKNIP
jgi:hypothetical protein